MIVEVLRRRTEEFDPLPREQPWHIYIELEMGMPSFNPPGRAATITLP
jgi:hypothetical protein